LVINDRCSQADRRRRLVDAKVTVSTPTGWAPAALVFGR
jgi:hypothetical protein